MSSNAQADVLHCTSTEPQDFLQAMERALQMGTDEAAIARGRAVAELGNWEARLEAMSKVIETKLPAILRRGGRQPEAELVLYDSRRLATDSE